jgi:allantoinase
MPLDPSYLTYANRRYGMDHDRYDWSMLADRVPVSWPNGAGVALWVNVALEFFPLNQQGKPFPPPGGMTTAYPDLRHFTLRDYGNRVGIVRCLKALDAHGITPTFAINAALVDRVPRLIERIASRGNEILGHGWHMDRLLHGELERGDEEQIIADSLAKLRGATGQSITGWLSPARSQSFNTPDILAANGIEYMGEWINDELPYPFRTSSGEMTAIPLSYELDDQFIMQANLHSETEYGDQIVDAADFLLREAAEKKGGRLLALNIHPWMLGQPHRIGQLERVLGHLAGQSGIWSASAGDIVAHWRSGGCVESG